MSSWDIRENVRPRNRFTPGSMPGQALVDTKARPGFTAWAAEILVSRYVLLPGRAEECQRIPPGFAAGRRRRARSKDGFAGETGPDVRRELL